MSMRRVCIVDCNNFYASCERLFRPDLWGKPIVVLSNNDGCVIARSNEVRAMGIKMGEPFFKIKALCQAKGVHVFSSNFSLYGDLSDRVMQILKTHCEDVYIYSIDEAFVTLNPSEQSDTFLHDLGQCVLQYTGVPVSIGVGATKTLAKAANHLAKRVLGVPVCALDTPAKLRHYLPQLALEDIWGVGSRLSKQLAASGFRHAYDLMCANRRWVRKRFNVSLEKTVLELRGLSCIELESAAHPKTIIASRSFTPGLVKEPELAEALSYFCSSAARRGREQGVLAAGIHVYLRNNRFVPSAEKVCLDKAYYFAQPTMNTVALIRASKTLLSELYRPGVRYRKAGITLLGLQMASHYQGHLFEAPEPERSVALMQAMDRINQKYGKNTVHSLALGVNPAWRYKQQQRSSMSTTRFSKLPVTK